MCIYGLRTNYPPMNMLIDQKQDIGLRYVEKVVLLKKDPTKDSRHFYFVLSEPRRAATPATQPLPDSDESE